MAIYFRGTRAHNSKIEGNTETKVILVNMEDRKSRFRLWEKGNRFSLG